MAATSKGLTTSDGIDVNEILYGTVLPIIDTYNEEEVIDLRPLLCVDATEASRKFEANPRWKFKKLGEGEKPEYSKIVWGKRQKDTKKYGIGLGYTLDWLYTKDATAQEIALMAKRAVQRDRALQTSIILNALAKSSTDGWFNASFTAAEKMLAPISFGASSFTASHTHYVASGSTTLALANITAGKKHLKEHGYSANIWGFANADFMAKIEDLAGWAALTSTAFIVPTKVVDQISIEGFRGRLLGIDWRETEWMPDDYFMLVGQGAARDKPAAFIQKENPAGRGLKLFYGDRADYPIINSYYVHWLECQSTHRGAGVVYNLATTFSDPSIDTNVIE